MKSLERRPLAIAAFALIACFGIFVLPFLFPPPPLQGISAANVAGFNNKVAAVATAFVSMGLLAFLYFQRRPTSAASQTPPLDFRRLPRKLVVAGMLFVCGIDVVITSVVARSTYIYRDDLDYFVNRLTQHVHFGRTLYEQIEFPYGPLLFYFPLLFQKLLFPLHLTLRVAYLITLNSLYFVGLPMLAYVLNVPADDHDLGDAGRPVRVVAPVSPFGAKR